MESLSGVAEMGLLAIAEFGYVLRYPNGLCILKNDVIVSQEVVSELLLHNYLKILHNNGLYEMCVVTSEGFLYADLI